MRFMLAVLLLLIVMPAMASSRFIQAKELGKDWPLTIEEGTLSCVKQGSAEVATIIAPGGKWWALNGAAQSRGYPAIDPIWKDDPNNEGAKVSIRPLINAALKLCE